MSKISLESLESNIEINLEIKQRLEEIIPRYVEIKKGNGKPSDCHFSHFEIKEDKTISVPIIFKTTRNNYETYDIPFYCLTEDNWEEKLKEEIRLEEETKERAMEDKLKMYIKTRELAENREVRENQKLNDFMKDRVEKIYEEFCALHTCIPGKVINYAISNGSMFIEVKIIDRIRSYVFPSTLVHSSTWKEDLKEVVKKGGRLT